MKKTQRALRAASPRPSGLTRTQLTIADMLRAAGRKVTVIDATRDQAVVDDEIFARPAGRGSRTSRSAAGPQPFYPGEEGGRAVTNTDPVLLSYEEGPGGYHFTYGWHIPMPRLDVAYLVEHAEERWERVQRRWSTKWPRAAHPSVPSGSTR